jgi:hypothetical protein
MSVLLRVLVAPGSRVVVGAVVIGALVGFPESSVVVAVIVLLEVTVEVKVVEVIVEV